MQEPTRQLIEHELRDVHASIADARGHVVEALTRVAHPRANPDDLEDTRKGLALAADTLGAAHMDLDGTIEATLDALNDAARGDVRPSLVGPADVDNLELQAREVTEGLTTVLGYLQPPAIEAINRQSDGAAAEFLEALQRIAWTAGMLRFEASRAAEQHDRPAS